MIGKRVLGAILSLLIAASMAGCTPEIQTRTLPTLPALPSAADAQKAVCDSLTAISSGLASLANVDATTAVSDIKAFKAQADTWVAAVKAANQVLNRPNITELTTAYDNLSLQISSLPDGTALGASATANIKSGVAAVQAALGQAHTALNCR